MPRFVVSIVSHVASRWATDLDNTDLGTRSSWWVLIPHCLMFSRLNSALLIADAKKNTVWFIDFSKN